MEITGDEDSETSALSEVGIALQGADCLAGRYRAHQCRASLPVAPRTCVMPGCRLPTLLSNIVDEPVLQCSAGGQRLPASSSKSASFMNAVAFCSACSALHSLDQSSNSTTCKGITVVLPATINIEDLYPKHAMRTAIIPLEHTANATPAGTYVMAATLEVLQTATNSPHQSWLRLDFHENANSVLPVL